MILWIHPTNSDLSGDLVSQGRAKKCHLIIADLWDLDSNTY